MRSGPKLHNERFVQLLQRRAGAPPQPLPLRPAKLLKGLYDEEFHARWGSPSCALRRPGHGRSRNSRVPMWVSRPAGIDDIAINSKKDAVIGGVFGGYDQEVAPNIILGAEGGFSLGASDRIGPSGANAATIDPAVQLRPVGPAPASRRRGRQEPPSYVRGGYANTRRRGDHHRSPMSPPPERRPSTAISWAAVWSASSPTMCRRASNIASTISVRTMPGISVTRRWSASPTASELRALERHGRPGLRVRPFYCPGSRLPPSRRS